MVWNVAQIDDADIDIFTQKYGMDRLAAALMLRRNIIDPAQLKFFLNDDLRLLHNPFLFSQMDTAVNRVLSAVSEGEKVLVFGDRDTDGITATVLMVSALRQEGLEVFWEVPMGDDAYGLSTAIVNTYSKMDVTLCITVDCGVGNINEIAQAKKLGMDCIVVDHHNPGEVLPDAVAVINPKCEFENYPFEGLSAVALVLKFLTAIDISKSDFYDQPMCFLNLRPGNESTIIEAVKILNLTEQSRIRETLVEGSGEKQLARVIEFIQNQPILVYQQDRQARLLSEVFGSSTDFALTDISEEIWKEFPSLKGKSLLRMLQGSRLSKFSQKAVEEIDAAAQLLTSYCYAKSSFILENLETRLDLVALGLIADMMPLLDENRIMVRHGLSVLEHTQRKGLRELMARLNLLGRSLTSVEVSWRLTPSLNAPGRMGSPDMVVRLLLEEGDVVKLADEIFTLNEERKQSGNTAWKVVLPAALESREEYNGVLSCVFHDSIHRGITGILAGRLSRKLNVPSIVMAELEEGYVGSVRGVRGFHVTDFLTRFSELLDDFGGHNAAGGFRFRKDRYHDFLAMLKEQSTFVELAGEEEPELNIDLELKASEVRNDLEKFQNSLGPVGQEFQQICYMLRGVQIINVQTVGKDASHLKLLLSIAERKWPAIYWSAAERFPGDFDRNSLVDCAFTLERNYFGNNSHLQLNILDIQNHEA